MRLFLRIFLSFWLALALSLTIAILLTIATRPERKISAIEALQPRFLDEAADAYCNGGTDRLEEYLRYLRDSQHTHSVLFDEHGPVVSHPIRPWFTETFEGKRRTADTFLGRISPHFQMLKTG